MKNLFSTYRFKSISTNIVFRLSIIAALLTSYFIYVYSQLSSTATNSIIFWIFSSLVLILPILLMFQFSISIKNSINKIFNLSIELKNGSFENRITEIDEIDELGQLSWAINDMTDQMEALLKEVSTSIEYSSKEKYFRRAMTTGLNNSLTKIADKVNNSLETQEKVVTYNKDQKTYLERNTNKILHSMDKFSNGDLTVSLIPENEDDAVGKLINAFNNSVGNIKKIMFAVIEAIESTASASTQIAASIQEISAGMQQQNAQTEQVVNSVGEMETSIAQVTQSSSEVRDAAEKSKNEVENGVNQVTNSKQGMNDILSSAEKNMTVLTTLGEKSNQIKDITQVINEIANQTNLLALNAAIESARAGEHGRGFSVVADEVKKLAEKTSNATDEISETIDGILHETQEANVTMKDSLSKVNIGIELTNKVEKSLSNILSFTKNVYDGIEEVATADEQQLNTVKEVRGNLSGINMVTEESAKGIEQMAIAMEDLNRLTENLQNLISNFTIEEKGYSEAEFEVEQNISIYQ